MSQYSRPEGFLVGSPSTFVGADVLCACPEFIAKTAKRMINGIDFCAFMFSSTFLPSLHDTPRCRIISMKILLTGFEPFGPVRVNPSEQIVRRIAAQAQARGDRD
ncbi:MAG: hypothetical protein ACRD88_15205, partial [Terriglobia bacterium]